MTQAPWTQREILNQKMRFEAICDQFEGACRAGQQPRIQDYVARATDEEREALVEELLAIERDYRRRPGPRVTLPKDDPPPPIDVESTVMLPPPTKVPSSSRYRILRLHARGGMGEVWLADDLAIGRRVAYKRIRDDRKPYGERFVIEAQITGQLEHPGIVPVHELGEDADGLPFYAMQFIKGRTFKEIIAQTHEEMARQPKSRELCLVKLLEIYLTVCRTVAYAHHRGVIHRDIKPDNIMVGSFGETMVIDWGLAKVLDSPDWLLSQPVHPTPGNGSTATLEGNVVGSLPYIAPEGAEGKIDEIDVKTDVYLLGGTLYEILTGRPPRQGSSREEFIELARTTAPKPPRQVNPHAPRALEALCQRAMAREKSARYDSAEELAAEAERYLAGDRVQAYAEPWSDRAGRWIRRHRRLLGRVAVAMILGAVTVTAGVMAYRAEAQRSELAKKLENEQRLKQAQADHEKLLQLFEQLHFLMADTTPLDGTLSFREPGEIERLKGKIQQIAERWGPDLSKFPLDDSRSSLRERLAESTLWRVQTEITFSPSSQQAQVLLTELDDTAGLNPPMASYHRLRADCLLLAGQSKLAAAALELAEQATRAPFDYFLEGERLRNEALQHRQDDDDPSLWRANRQHVKEALKQYEHCLGLDYAHFWARLQKGRCHLLVEEMDEALVEFDHAVILRPQSPWALSARGFAHLVLNNFKAAERDLRDALKRDPDFVPAQLSLGAWHLRAGRISDSKAAFNKVSQQHPNNVQARYYLSMAELAAKDYAAALKECSAVLESHPQLGPPRLLRAQIHSELGKVPEARADLDRWLALRDATLDLASAEAAAERCHAWRGLAARVSSPASNRRALELARNDGNAAIDGGIKSAGLHDDLAAVLYGLRRLDQAIPHIAAGLACVTTPLMHAKLRNKRVLFRLEMTEPPDRLALAKEDCNQTVALKGDERQAQIARAEARSYLAYIAAIESQPDEAQRQVALATAELRGANHYVIWHNLACTYAALADKQPGQVTELQEAAMAMVQKTVYHAQRVGAHDEARRLIEGDSSLESLRRRRQPEFLELLKPSP